MFATIQHPAPQPSAIEPNPHGNRAQRRAWAKLARLPLGRRNPADINQTLLRVAGKDHTPALAVAAFQSFAD